MNTGWHQYDCPGCIKEDDRGEHYGIFGVFEVRGHVEPSRRGTPEHPPEAARITEIEIRPVGKPCRHGELYDVRQSVVDLFEQDFEDGEFEEDLAPDPDLYLDEADVGPNEWEGPA